MSGNVFDEGGFSAIAAVVIAALVVIGGLAITATNNNSNQGTNSQAATNTQQTTQEPAQQDSQNQSNNQQTSGPTVAGLQCEGGEKVELTFYNDGKVTLTLPNKDPIPVEQKEVSGQPQFTNEEKGIVFKNTDNGAVVQKEGETMLSGCTPSRN